MIRNSAALVFVASVFFVHSVTPPEASAQTMMEEDEPHTFQDATGVIWGLGTFEVVTIAGMLIPIALGVCEDGGCGGWAAGAGLLAGIGLGLAAGLADWPADGGFIMHQAFLGLGIGLAFGSGIASAAGADPETARIIGFVSGAALALGLGSYSFARRDDLIRDPDLAPPAHLMSWGTMGTISLGALLGIALGVDDTTLTWVIGAIGLATYAGLITWVELARDGVDAAPAPLLGIAEDF